MRDYHDAVAEDNTAKQLTRKLGKGIATSANKAVGLFKDRAHLVDTLTRLSDNETLPWADLVKAGTTLEQLTAETEGPASVDGAVLGHLVTPAVNKRKHTRGQ